MKKKTTDKVTNKDKFKGEQCEFQTEYKANLQWHLEKQHNNFKDTAQVHDEDDEVEENSSSGVDDSKQGKFSCELCMFKSGYKANLVRHEEMRKHKKKKATAQAQVPGPS